MFYPLFISNVFWCSSMVEQVAVNHKVGGSSPSARANALVAQLDERGVSTAKVEGSNPSEGSN